MARILKRRPSPAMVIALIALFVAMGGVSYGVATGSIDSRELKNNTVKSGDLKNNDIRGKDIRSSTIGGSDVASNTLKGADIDESSLGKVPSATSADTAAKATTADTATKATTADALNGIAVRKFFFKGPANTGLAPRYQSNGFTLNAGCNATGDPLVTITGENASAKSVATSGVAIFTRNLTGDFANQDVLGTQQFGTGQIGYALSDGTALTVNFTYDDTNTFDNEPVCTVFGTVTAG